MFVQRLAPPRRVCSGHLLRIIDAVVRGCGSLGKSNSYSPSPLPVVLPPADPQAKYAEFLRGERDPLFLPRIPVVSGHREIHPPPRLCRALPSFSRAKSCMRSCTWYRNGEKVLAGVHRVKACLLEDGEALACAVGDAVGLVEGSVCFCTIWRSFAPHRLPALRLFHKRFALLTAGRPVTGESPSVVDRREPSPSLRPSLKPGK